jgi:hypothetical protein
VIRGKLKEKRGKTAGDLTTLFVAEVPAIPTLIVYDPCDPHLFVDKRWQGFLNFSAFVRAAPTFIDLAPGQYQIAICVGCRRGVALIDPFTLYYFVRVKDEIG